MGYKSSNYRLIPEKVQIPRQVKTALREFAYRHLKHQLILR